MLQQYEYGDNDNEADAGYDDEQGYIAKFLSAAFVTPRKAESESGNKFFNQRCNECIWDYYGQLIPDPDLLKSTSQSYIQAEDQEKLQTMRV